MKAADIAAKLGDPSTLPSIAERRSEIRAKLKDKLKDFIAEVKSTQAAERAPLDATRLDLRNRQNTERNTLSDQQRLRRIGETKARQDRFARGLRGLWDRLTGKTRAIRLQNEKDAAAAALRDRTERDALVKRQLAERQQLQIAFDGLKRRHAEARKLLAREVARHLRQQASTLSPDQSDRSRSKRREFDGPQL